MHSHLFLGHWHKEILIHSLWHLELYVLLSAADENVAQLLADVVEVLIAKHFACLVLDDMLLLEQIVRGKAEVIDKLHDGVKFVELVLQRCA